MALTVVKRKNSQGRNPINTNVLPTIPTLKRNTNFKVVQPDRNTNIVVRTSSSSLAIPQKLIKPESTGNIVPMKRNNYFNPNYESTPKAPKLAGKQFSLQRIASTGTPLTTFDGKVLIQSGGGGNNNTNLKQQFVRSANPIKIKPGTAIKIEPNQLPFIQSNGTISSTTAGGHQQTYNNNNTVRRPTIFIKGPTVQKRTIRSITIELIEKNPYLHLGITEDRLGILQNIICPTVNITRIDLYITLKKLRLNEDFQILGEYFEYNELDIQRIFQRTLIKLSKCMKYLVRWPESKKYYDRHKNLPISFRSKLSFVQSLIECVETDVKQSQYPQTIEQLECKNYKYILTITPSGIISYVSNAYVGNNHDDLSIFNACNFRNIIPKYLSLVADPGKAIRKKAIKTTTTTTPDDNDNNNSGIITIKSDKFNINKLDSRITKRTGSSITTNTISSGGGGNNNNIKTLNQNDDNDDDNIIDNIITNSIDSDTDSDDSNTDSADEIDEIIDNDGRKIYKRNKNNNNSGINNNNKKKTINKISSKTTSINSSMNIINSELTSLNVKDFSIPTVRVREPACRLQIRNLIYLLREFKILQTFNILEPQIYQYINEILVICSALINLQR